MKRFFMIIAIVGIHLASYSQYARLPKANADSLLNLLNEHFLDTGTVNDLLYAAQEVMYDNVVKATELSIKALDCAQNIGYAEGKATALTLLGEALSLRGNYAEGIETSLKGVHEAEKTNIKDVILYANTKLGVVYGNFGDYAEALKYYRKTINTSGGNEVLFGLVGEAFNKLNILDSALEYCQKAYLLDLKNVDHWGLPYVNLGDIHLKLMRYSMALEYYRTALALKPPTLDIVIAQVGIATVYNDGGQRDSALWYAQQAAAAAKNNSYLMELISSYNLIKNLYKKEKKLDSAFVYQELILAARDSMYATEKINVIQNLKFNQQIKELEIEQLRQKNIQDRKNSLQLWAIGIGLVSFIILFFSLSSSIIVKEKFVSFFGIIALLLVFEFINLLSHPFVGDFTNHSPLWTFLIMVCIAALLVPTHHRIEKWITHQLVEKNKRIRLAAAKRTIASLNDKRD
jgi:tetratricopeptide (TPR) repeat protein